MASCSNSDFLNNTVRAVKSKDSKGLQLILETCQSLQKKELNYGLLRALEYGAIECVKLLIKAGAQVQDDLNSALKKAAEQDDAESIQLLVINGANVNKYTKYGGSALHVASRRGNQNAVKELIILGSGINMLDKRKNTPLLLAAMECQRTCLVLKILVEAGCDTNVRDVEGRIALHYCCNKGFGSEILAKTSKVNIQDNDGNTPMHLAAIGGRDGAIYTLLSYNADPNKTNKFGMTPAHYFAIGNMWKCIVAITESEADLNIIDDKGRIPLWHAVNRNRPESVKSLLKGNCLINPPRQANTPDELFIPIKNALFKGLFGIAKLLILAGCDLNPVNEWVKNAKACFIDKSGINDSNNVISPHIYSNLVDDHEILHMLDWLEYYNFKPHTLRQLCRLQIRKQLGSTISKWKVSLPVFLIDYVMLKEIDQYVISSYVI